MSITVKLADLRNLVGITGRFTDPSPLAPDFSRILFRAGVGLLTATATDRYTAATARVESDAQPYEWSLTAAECRAILATFRGATLLTITTEGNEVSIGRAEGLIMGQRTSDAYSPAARLKSWAEPEAVAA